MNERENAGRSTAEAGEIASKPQELTAVVVSGEDNEAQGVLEDWGGDVWIYAEVDSLVDIN